MVVPAEEWTHGEAKGICEQLSLVDVQPLVEVGDRENEAELPRTLIHQYAHALLHFDVDDDTELSKREVEAGAVANVVGRYCGLDTNTSAFYLAAENSKILKSFVSGFRFVDELGAGADYLTSPRTDPACASCRDSY